MASRSRMHDGRRDDRGVGRRLDAAEGPNPYVATWYDGSGRQTATADYGTNGGTRPHAAHDRARPAATLCWSPRPSTTRRRMAWKTIDPKGTENRRSFDDAGRVTKTIQNYADVARLGRRREHHGRTPPTTPTGW